MAPTGQRHPRGRLPASPACVRATSSAWPIRLSYRESSAFFLSFDDPRVVPGGQLILRQGSPVVSGPTTKTATRFLPPVALIERRAVAIDMIGQPRHARAVAADNGFERLVQPAVVGVGGGEPLARGLDPLDETGQIERDDPPVVDNHP